MKYDKEKAQKIHDNMKVNKIRKLNNNIEILESRIKAYNKAIQNMKEEIESIRNC